MNWHYVKAGQSVGPVSETDLQNLARAGEIQPDTLVWHEGLANWQRAVELQPGLWASTPLGAAAVGSAPPVVAPSTGEVVCAECGKIISRENAIQYSSTWVCGACKPVFIQKLREGVVVPEVGGQIMNYGGFWIRVGAKLIDGLIFGVVLLIPIMLFAGFAVWGSSSGRTQPGALGAEMVLQLVMQLGFMVLSVGYNTFFLGKYGATLGKMACGLRVVTAQGTPLTYGRAFGRSCAELLSGFICDIGYIIAAFDSEKRALHDHIAGTRVVRK